MPIQAHSAPARWWTGGGRAWSGPCFMPTMSLAGPLRLSIVCGLALCGGTAVHRLLQRCANTLGQSVQPRVSTASATPIMGWSIDWFVVR